MQCIKLSPSSYLQYALRGFYTVNLVSGLFLPLTWQMLIIGLVVHHWQTSITASNIICFTSHAWYDAQGNPLALGSAYIHPWFSVLRFRQTNGKPYIITVLPDQLSAAHFCQLRRQALLELAP